MSEQEQEIDPEATVDPAIGSTPAKSGFEIDGEFFPWRVSDKIVDLQLIDHFAEMPPYAFFAAVEDGFDRNRTPMMAAMMATSMRHRRPRWSRQRITRYIEDLNMSDVIFFDEEDDDEGDNTLVPLISESDDDEDTPESSQRSNGQQDAPSKKSSKTQRSSGQSG